MTSVQERPPFSADMAQTKQSLPLPSGDDHAAVNGTSNNEKKVKSGGIIPPPIPHITENMTPLGSIIERVGQDTFKRFKEFFMYLESTTDPDVVKKKHFLDILTTIRENYLRLYVIYKWSKNHKEISQFIDLFVWLREQNQTIQNVIGTFGGIKSSLISAKIPEPDLVTSLEVLLQGRPDLPTYNFLEGPELRPEFVLKVLQNLNVELSIKMASQETLPKEFHSYTIKNGAVCFNVPGYFSCSLSMLSDEKFRLIDFNLGFKLENSIIVPTQGEDTNSTILHTIQNYCDTVVNDEGFGGLYDILYNFSINSKIYLIHKQLIDLRMGLWRGNMTHSYTAEKSLITVSYWLQKKNVKPTTVQIGKFQNKNGECELSFKWFKEEVLQESIDVRLINDDGNIDILLLLNTLIKEHIKSIILQLKEKLIESVEDVDKMIIISSDYEKLTFKIAQFKEITFSIDPLSGSSYFENPTNMMNRSAYKINCGISMNFIEILRLKMLIQESMFASMMNATGWVHLNNIRLSVDEIPKLKINYSNLKNGNLRSALTSIGVYRRKDWPTGWAILVAHFGFQSNVQLWCSKIQSIEGQWIINWCSEIELRELYEDVSGLCLTSALNMKTDVSYNEKQKQEEHNGPNEPTQLQNQRSMTYTDLVGLVKIASSKLTSNLIIKELIDHGCKLKILNLGDKLVNDFLIKNFKIDMTNLASTENAVMLIKNDSLFHIQNSKDSLILLISIKSSELSAKIYGQLIDNKSSRNLPDISFSDDYNTSIEYTSSDKRFKIESTVDLSSQFPLSISDKSSYLGNNLILSNTLSFLEKFAKTLNLLKIISRDSGLSIIRVLSDSITFQYGPDENEYITLRISSNGDGSINLELPPENPHYKYSQHLNSIVAAAPFNSRLIKELVLYMTETLKYCKAIDKICEGKAKALEDFNRKNDAVDYKKDPTKFRIMPEYGYVPSICNIENFRITYFRQYKVDIQQSSGKKKNTKSITDVLKFEILVELRHRINCVSKKHSKFFITLGDLRTDTLGVVNTMAQVKESYSKAEELIHCINQVCELTTKYFNGENFPTKIASGGIVFLQDGICCDFESIDIVLLDLHAHLLGLITPPNSKPN